MFSGAATGLPVDASLRLEYGTSSESGAVLITASPVTRNGYHYQSPFKDWVKANARALLHGPLGADIKENGLFVVTQTHATEKVALTAWKNSQNKAYFGFGAGVTGLGEISPHVQWYMGNSESGWNVHEAEPGESKVVFVGGLAYRRKWPLAVRSVSCQRVLALMLLPECVTQDELSGSRSQPRRPDQQSVARGPDCYCGARK